MLTYSQQILKCFNRVLKDIKSTLNIICIPCRSLNKCQKIHQKASLKEGQKF